MKSVGVFNIGGNLNSILKSLKSCNVKPVVLSYKKLQKCDSYILPGVGQASTAMKILRKAEVLHFLRSEVIKNKKNILGICLGMQLFADYSSEGDCDCLGWIKGNVQKIDFSQTFKTPHVGWCSLNEIKPSLLKEIKRKAFYFLHTYKFVPKNKKLIKAFCKSKKRIVAIIKKDNLYGVQFHPEKSGQAGKKLIENFLNA